MSGGASSSCPCGYTAAISNNSGRRVLPPSRNQMGRASWRLLHTTAAQFPSDPSAQECRSTFRWLVAFSLLYPCHICREAFIPILLHNPPATNSQKDLVLWACRVHNEVNDDISQPQYDCSDKRLLKPQRTLHIYKVSEVFPKPMEWMVTTDWASSHMNQTLQ